MAMVFVGLSGGVDSAVAAALLKRAGHDVVGCFIKIWQPEFIECTWREDRLDAMRVAAALGIPFREIDFSAEYKQEVVDDMILNYSRGITPNPDVLCNSAIKFGHFLSWALEKGAEMIATGHYARITHERLTKSFMLRRGKDAQKDQSYFLWQLGQHELSHSLLPIGDLTKGDVRLLAKKFALLNANRPDSQGLCFVGDVTLPEFLSRYLALKSGAVLDSGGDVIGEHQGAALYTIGQRHGFAVRNSDARGDEHYVMAIDTAANAITVSRDRRDAKKCEITLEGVRWINPLSLPCEAHAKTRYREASVRVRIEEEAHRIRVLFTEPHLVAPGQSLVLYQKDVCLGGGIISALQ